MEKKYRPTISKLSPYTKAKNCTDLQDCKDGIEEMKKFFNYYEAKKLKIPNEALIRFYKLRKKEDILKTKRKK